MITWSNKHITLVTALFLGAFLGAFAINSLCDLELIDYASNLSHNHQDVIESTNVNHHASQAHVHDHSPVNKQNTNSHHPSSNDACCEDAASILESSLFSVNLKFNIPSAKFYLVRIIQFVDLIIPSYHFDNSIYHEYDDPPPLNGFNLRVVIQSFLN